MMLSTILFPGWYDCAIILVRHFLSKPLYSSSDCVSSRFDLTRNQLCTLRYIIAYSFDKDGLVLDNFHLSATDEVTLGGKMNLSSQT